jgi:serine/threonine protein kinase/tetratricopeptide (TPR) repeat protein
VEETEDGQTFIAMAYYEGETLKEKIGRGPLEVEAAVDFTLQVAEGLKEAHEKNIVHRDIKAANVMITSKGQAKVLDFGLAQLTGRTKLTRTGTTSGTAAYMSPEQTKGDKVDHRSDIWSLGVMLYEMLTGQLPFKGDYEQAVVYHITSEAPDPVTGLRTGISLDLERIVVKCLEKDPSRRYQHIEDLAVDLRAIQETSSDTSVKAPATRSGHKQKWLMPALGSLVILLALWTLDPLRLFHHRTVGSANIQKKIVVLPFENLGHEEEDYFAAGVTEEITSHLASLHTLGVISRQSALHYIGISYSTAQIGKELDVHYILNGTIRWAPIPAGEQRVRITVHLVRVEDDIEIWTQTYEHVLEDIFRIQSDIAHNVVDALGMTLSQPHLEEFAEQPTDNMEAYQAFLRGRWSMNRPHFSLDAWTNAIESFQTAIRLDSEFGLAYAELAKAHARMYNLRYDVSENRLKFADEAAREAIRLNPESAEVRLALGYYYLWAYRDRAKALAEWAVAEKKMPNSVDILISKGDLYEPMGRWEEGIQVIERAFELSPKDADLPTRLALFYWVTRQYEKASAAADQAITLAPDEDWPYLYKTFVHWGWKGGPDDVSRAILSASPLDEDHEWYLWAWYYQEVGERRYKDAFELIDRTPGEWSNHKLWALPKDMLRGFIHLAQSEEEKARECFDRSIPLLRESVNKYPNDPRYHSSLGVSLAGIGHREEAIQEGKKAVALLPISEDAAYGIVYVADLAQIYAMLGDVEAALEQIEILLKVPSWYSPNWMDMDIRYSSLAGNKEYEAVLEKYRQ